MLSRYTVSCLIYYRIHKIRVNSIILPNGEKQLKSAEQAQVGKKAAEEYFLQFTNDSVKQVKFLDGLYPQNLLLSKMHTIKIAHHLCLAQ